MRHRHHHPSQTACPRPALTLSNRTANRLQRGVRALGERGFALLTQRWRLLQHITARPRQDQGHRQSRPRSHTFRAWTSEMKLAGITSVHRHSAVETTPASTRHARTAFRPTPDSEKSPALKHPRGTSAPPLRPHRRQTQTAAGRVPAAQVGEHRRAVDAILLRKVIDARTSR